MKYKTLAMEVSLSKDGIKIKGKTATMLLNDEQITFVRESPFVISGPGEYELDDVMVFGYKDKEGSMVYKFSAEGMSFCFFSKLDKKITGELLEKIGPTNIILTPVIPDLPKMVVGLDPKIVVLTSSDQADVSSFLDQFGKKDQPSIDKLNINVGKLPDELSVVYFRN